MNMMQTTQQRPLTPLDKLFVEVSKAMEILSGSVRGTRANPAGPVQADDPVLTPAEQRHAAGLMRINHVGEICAQALYRGQALVCKDPTIHHVLMHAASEEVDHLAWCYDRITELNSRPSLLNPFWYAGSFALGVVASVTGTARNMGFMAETERQVEAHLNHHLETLPPQDIRSRKIVTQMRDDEINHANTAIAHGGVELPAPVKVAMKLMSKVMTTLAYRI
ncbi:2-polyprenyl-3-methyl-6-methoxy-1,4-benzoquinone monooxygenase [Basilea psittacipulmonis]